MAAPVDVLEENGRVFGYPECCIKAFAHPLVPAHYRPSIVRRATYAGFMPCPAHAEAILKGETTHAYLIRGRAAPFPFPNDGEYPPITEEFKPT